MDEILFGEVVKKISLFAGIIGILAGLDLVSGARITATLKRILDRSVDMDKLIIRITSSLRKKLDKAVVVDEVIIKAKIIFGIVLLFFSILMISLVVTTR